MFARGVPVHPHFSHVTSDAPAQAGARTAANSSSVRAPAHPGHLGYVGFGKIMASFVVSHSSFEFAAETLLFMGQLSPAGMTFSMVPRSPERAIGERESWVRKSDRARKLVSGSEKQRQVLQFAARQPRHLRTVLPEEVQP